MITEASLNKNAKIFHNGPVIQIPKIRFTYLLYIWPSLSGHPY